MVSEVSLRGFLAWIHCPSEEYLTVTIDCSSLSPPTYMQLVTQLQDILSEVDFAYAEREVRGRSLKARYRRISANERLRLLKFSPFPSRINNKLKYVRAKAYELLNHYCVSITSIESGFYREKIYALPESLAEEFINRINMLNREIGEVREFVEGFDYSSVELLLSRYGLTMPTKTFNVPDIRVDLIPIAFALAIQEWAGRSETVQQLLAKKQEELIRNIVGNLKERLEPIVKALEGERKIRRIKRRLEEIRNIADGLGLKALSKTVIAPLIEATENPEALQGKKPSEFVSGRIASLLR
jgi:hypothetical protein